MHCQILNPRRGSAIAFMLMGLIAILAIVVVLLSRAKRAPDPATLPDAQVTTGTLTEHFVPKPNVIGGTTSTEAVTANTPTPAPEATPQADAQIDPEIQLPPPPPSISATPDTRNLPPEG